MVGDAKERRCCCTVVEVGMNTDAVTKNDALVITAATSMTTTTERSLGSNDIFLFEYAFIIIKSAW